VSVIGCFDFSWFLIFFSLDARIILQNRQGKLPFQCIINYFPFTEKYWST